MASINCPHEACSKVFEKPVVVTNFSFPTKKETYYACPYCLTRIGIAINDCELASHTAESGNLNETSITPQIVQDYASNGNSDGPFMGTQKTSLKNIRNLEKEKADLLAELEELRKGAEEKISRLEKEVAALKEEADILKHLTGN